MSVEKFSKSRDEDIIYQNYCKKVNWKITLEKMYESFNFSALTPFHALKDNWHNIVPNPIIAEYCKPNSFEDGVLYIKIKSSTARVEFLNNIDFIKENINSLLPELKIKDIKIARR